MVCFWDIQKIFDPFSISLITTPGCILCTAELNHFIPLLCNFFHCCYCYYLGQKGVHVKDSFSLVTSIYHTPVLFHTCTHTQRSPWRLNSWHVMHRNISTHILKNKLCWSPFTQCTWLEQTTDWLHLFYRWEFFAYFGVELTSRSWVRFSPSQLPLVKIRSQPHKEQCGRLKMKFFIHDSNDLDHYGM